MWYEYVDDDDNVEERETKTQDMRFFSASITQLFKQNISINQSIIQSFIHSEISKCVYTYPIMAVVCCVGTSPHTLSRSLRSAVPLLLLLPAVVVVVVVKVMLTARQVNVLPCRVANGSAETSKMESLRCTRDGGLLLLLLSFSFVVVVVVVSVTMGVGATSSVAVAASVMMIRTLYQQQQPLSPLSFFLSLPLPQGYSLEK